MRRPVTLLLLLALSACSKRIQDQAQQSSGTLGDPAPSASAGIPVETPPPPPPPMASGLGVGVGPTGSAPSTALSFGEAPQHFGPKPNGELHFGAVSVTGRLPPEVIQRVVRQNLGGIRSCYDSGLARNAKLAGKVVVRFVIGQDGAVSSATSDPDTTLGDATVVSCIVDHFKKITFPTPEGGIVTVVYPLTFSHEE